MSWGQVLSPIGNIRSPWTYLKVGTYLIASYQIISKQLPSSADKLISRVQKFLSGEDDSSHFERAKTDLVYRSCFGLRDELRALTRTAMIAGGAYISFREFGKNLIGGGTLSASRNFTWTFGFESIYLLSRLWSDSAGNAMIRVDETKTSAWNFDNFHPEDDFSWDLFAGNQGMDLVFAPYFGRTSNIAHRATLKLIGAPLEVEGQTAPSPLRLTAGEQDDIFHVYRNGRMPGRIGRITRVGMGLGAAYLLYKGISTFWSRVVEGEGSKNPYADAAWYAAGAAGLTVLAGLIFPIPKLGNALRAASMIPRYLFGTRDRFKYFAINLAIGGTFNAIALGLTQYAMGYRDLGLIFTEASRTYVTSIPGRLLQTGWQIFTPRPLSIWAQGLINHALIIQPVRIPNQTKQSVDRKYDEMANAWFYSTSEAERSEYMGRMRLKFERLERSAEAKGPESIFGKQLERIQKINKTYGIPV